MVVLSAKLLSPSDLGRELVDEIGVRTRIDLALEQLRGRLHCDLSHFTAQTLAGVSRVQLDLLMSCSHEALTLGRRRALRLLDEVVGAVLSLVDDLRGALTCFTDDRVGLVTGFRQSFLAFLARSKPLRDLARALLHRTEDHRPHEFHRCPDEDREDHHLNDERQVEGHSRLLPRASESRTCSAAAASSFSVPHRGLGRLQCGNERIREREEQGEADADERARVQQSDENEGTTEQGRCELGLARHSLQEAAAEQAEADGRAERSMPKMMPTAITV